MTTEVGTRCGAKTRNGGTCALHPMLGGARCRMHGGSSPQAKRAAAARLAQAEAAAVLDSLPRVDPSEALSDAQAVLRALLVQAQSSAPDLAKVADLAERLARVAKANVDSSVQLRRAAVDEAQLGLLASALDLVLRDLGHDPDAPEVRTIVHRRLLEIDSAGPLSGVAA